jgi:hypothetical protein
MESDRSGGPERAETYACRLADLGGAVRYPWHAESGARALVSLCSPGSGDGGYLSLDRRPGPRGPAGVSYAARCGRRLTDVRAGHRERVTGPRTGSSGCTERTHPECPAGTSVPRSGRGGVDPGPPD